ncbi:hypothetical protein SAMN05216480_106131 [Pustulibacterium marinum]|uniref:Glycosyltransferase 2-like domain-containing protein n=1 Tax=Pustulibacterium marinum TaxID=1224947 RepID=A0A1I7GZL5_9FLAO|nr:glycosyltransferase family 2 protein [Pustulibacterium marinum]SFU53879.1 hypothetical protein SAMN05216480_106131 [Pustulibacterium marinum]
MNIAVVILNWNGKKWLEKFLPTVIKYSPEANIYVADNASTDDSVSYVQNTFPQVKVIQNTLNGGYAQGYNQALKAIEEPYLCLLNSDVEVTENWLVPILALFEQNTEIAAIQPKILDYKNKACFEYAGAAGGFIDKFGYPFCRGRIFDTVEKDEGQYDDVSEIFWASGACFFIRNSEFKKHKGFDERFFAHMEEIDLCWRIKNSGKKVYYNYKSVVYHVGGGTLNSSRPQKTYLNFRNSLFTLLKNLPETTRNSIVFKRMTLDAIAIIKYLMTFKFGHALAIFNAHMAYYQNKQSFLQNDIKNDKNLNYYLVESIVRQYYVSKRKQFRNLIKN